MSTDFHNRLVDRLAENIQAQAKILLNSAGLNPTDDRYICGMVKGFSLAIEIADQILKEQNASRSNPSSKPTTERAYDV